VPLVCMRVLSASQEPSHIGEGKACFALGEIAVVGRAERDWLRVLLGRADVVFGLRGIVSPSKGGHLEVYVHLCCPCA